MGLNGGAGSDTRAAEDNFRLHLCSFTFVKAQSTVLGSVHRGLNSQYFRTNINKTTEIAVMLC